MREVQAIRDPVRKTRAINMDLVNSVDQRQVASMTFGLLNYLQNRRDAGATGAQLVAVAAMFTLMADVFGVSPQTLATVAGNVITDAGGRYIPEFKAIAMYIEKEIKA